MNHKIPIEILDTYDGGCHLMLEACFSNNLEGTLIIDTGANKTVFDSMLLKDCVENVTAIKDDISAGINSNIENSKRARLKNLRICEFEINNYETTLIDLSYLNDMYQKIAKRKIYGLLGGDFLKKYRAIINYKSKKIELIK